MWQCGTIRVITICNLTLLFTACMDFMNYTFMAGFHMNCILLTMSCFSRIFYHSVNSCKIFIVSPYHHRRHHHRSRCCQCCLCDSYFADFIYPWIKLFTFFYFFYFHMSYWTPCDCCCRNSWFISPVCMIFRSTVVVDYMKSKW